VPVDAPQAAPPKAPSAPIKSVAGIAPVSAAAEAAQVKAAIVAGMKKIDDDYNAKKVPQCASNLLFMTPPLPQLGFATSQILNGMTQFSGFAQNIFAAEPTFHHALQLDILQVNGNRGLRIANSIATVTLSGLTKPE
jgi:hypothetical protein